MYQQGHWKINIKSFLAASIQSGQLVIQAILQSLMILLRRGLLDNSSQHINIIKWILV